MLSPDGKWVWDGSRWLPLADPSTATHHAVFAAWNSVSVEAPVAPEPVRVAVAPAVVAAPASMPVPIAGPDVVVVPEQPAIPQWQEPPRPGYDRYLYAIAAVVALVIAGYAFNALVPIDTLFGGGGGSPTRTAAGPPPIGVRSDYARAARYANGFLTPQMVDWSQFVQVTRETCSGPMTLSCQSAITSSDTQATKMMRVIDREPIPLCIAAPVARLRADLSKTHDALQLALKGFTDNQASEFGQGVAHFNGAVAPVAADAAAITAAKQACDVAVSGP